MQSFGQLPSLLAHNRAASHVMAKTGSGDTDTQGPTDCMVPAVQSFGHLPSLLAHNRAASHVMAKASSVQTQTQTQTDCMVHGQLTVCLPGARR